MVETKEIRVSSPENVPAIDDNQIQPASIDLRLGRYAYPVDTSFLPGRGLTVLEKMQQLDSRYEDFKIDLQSEKGAVLEKGRVYMIPLLEEIHLRSDIAGFANPKSSTGRLDILTRLITDQGTIFDEVERGYKGKLYVEVVPRSFSIVVTMGTRLNQLRFRKTDASAPQAISQEAWNRLLEVIQTDDPKMKQGDEKGMLRFTVDLKGNGNEGAIIGYRARKHARRIDLDKRDYDPLEFWEPIRFYKQSSLILDPDEFYILMTKEAVAVPPEYAAEMIPYDTRAGEFRVHYAGFFDPGFGWDTVTGKAGSSKAVLEVRSHEVPFLLEHGQTVGWLRYERMAAAPNKLYGADSTSHYQNQGLKLGKQFLPLTQP